MLFTYHGYASSVIIKVVLVKDMEIVLANVKDIFLNSPTLFLDFYCSLPPFPLLEESLQSEQAS